jgi:hypothetical protein
MDMLNRLVFAWKPTVCCLRWTAADFISNNADLHAFVNSNAFRVKTYDRVFCIDQPETRSATHSPRYGTSISREAFPGQMGSPQLPGTAGILEPLWLPHWIFDICLLVSEVRSAESLGSSLVGDEVFKGPQAPGYWNYAFIIWSAACASLFLHTKQNCLR